MSQKLPVNEFKWVEDIPEFNEDLIERYNDDSTEGYFLEVEFQYPENLHNLFIFFLPETVKIEKFEKVVAY